VNVIRAGLHLRDRGSKSTVSLHFNDLRLIVHGAVSYDRSMDLLRRSEFFPSLLCLCERIEAVVLAFVAQHRKFVEVLGFVRIAHDALSTELAGALHMSAITVG
jgi:hypothetical protein